MSRTSLLGSLRSGFVTQGKLVNSASEDAASVGAAAISVSSISDQSPALDLPASTFSEADHLDALQTAIDEIKPIPKQTAERAMESLGADPLRDESIISDPFGAESIRAEPDDSNFVGHHAFPKSVSHSALSDSSELPNLSDTSELTVPVPSPELLHSSEPVDTSIQPGVLDSVMTQAVDATAEALVSEYHQQHVSQVSSGRTGREQEFSSLNVLENGIADAGDIQFVEQEPQPELPVEVAGYLDHVALDHTATPAEIVLAAEETVPVQKKFPKQSVIVLPIDQKDEKVGQKKSFKYSFRWLVEWSRKIIKMFDGKVIYR